MSSDPVAVIDNLFIRTLEGTTKTFHALAPSTTIGTLKGLVQDKTGLPPAEQRLVFAGKQLDRDTSTLDEYGIQNESTIFVVIRLLGGATRAARWVALRRGADHRGNTIEKQKEDVKDSSLKRKNTSKEADGDDKKSKTTHGEPEEDEDTKAPWSADSLRIGDVLDARDERGYWYSAIVLELREAAVCVQWPGWGEEWNAVIPKGVDRLARKNTHVPVAAKIAKTLAKGDFIEASHSGRWWQAKIVNESGNKVLVHYPGYGDSWTEWIDKTNGRLRVYAVPQEEPEEEGAEEAEAGSDASVEDEPKEEGAEEAEAGGEDEPGSVAPRLPAPSEVKVVPPLWATVELKVGDVIDCFDRWNKWYEATVIEVKTRVDSYEVRVHYNGWSATYDEWISRHSDRLASKNTHTTPSSPKPAEGPVPEKKADELAPVPSAPAAEPSKKLTLAIVNSVGLSLAAEHECCMIKQEALKEEPRARMDCGHVITAEGLTALANSVSGLTSEDGHAYEVTCPERLSDTGSGSAGVCGRFWSWKVVRAVAMLKPDENTSLETKLSMNCITGPMQAKKCPGCGGYCLVEGALGANKRVVCVVCLKKPASECKANPSRAFCWACCGIWKDGPQSAWCGNRACASAKAGVLATLQNALLVNLAPGLSFPGLRACPHCLTQRQIRIVEHKGEGCKHLQHTGVGGCGKSFCASCLTLAPTAFPRIWRCGGVTNPCPEGTAPRQDAASLAHASLP